MPNQLTKIIIDEVTTCKDADLLDLICKILLATRQEEDVSEHTERLNARWRKYEGFGEAHGLREWARLLDLPHGSVRRYLLRGMTIEEVARLRGVKYPI